VVETVALSEGVRSFGCSLWVNIGQPIFEALDHFIGVTGEGMSCCLVRHLHYNFTEASKLGNDMMICVRFLTIVTVCNNQHFAVTLVDNRDSRPLQSFGICCGGLV
jgi:hypothetical protein